MYNTEVRLVLYEVQVEVHELILVLIVSNMQGDYGNLTS